MRKSTNILLTLVFVFASMGVFAQKGLIDIKKLQDREYYPTSVLVKYVNDKGSETSHIWDPHIPKQAGNLSW